MENASKALIIAGAILLSILIIALGIYVFNMAKSATNTEQLSELEISQWNTQFTDYDGPALGSMVASLLNKVMSNASNNKEADERLIDIVYVDSRSSAKLDDFKPTGSATDEDNTAKDKALAAAGVEGSDYVHIYSNSNEDSLNLDAMGKLRNSLANRHYYQITSHQDEATGYIDCIVINYTSKK